jgi:adenine-specific DNA-methyltransferase
MAKRRQGTKEPTRVDSIKHKDTRKNIPTEELRDFVAADEAAPSRMLYPRDPSLTPMHVFHSRKTERAHG